MYQNPVIRGFHPDPSVCRVGDSFYLVTSSFQYFPGIPIFHSTDLVNWQQIGHCITRESQLDLARVPDSGGIWAPTIRYHDGRFFVISTVLDDVNFTNRLDADLTHDASAIEGRHFIVSTSDPRAEWSDPVWVSGGGFDPSLHFESDGRAIVTHADRGRILQGYVDVETGRREDEPRTIWTGTEEVDTEGPHLYRIGDYYYLLVAEGGTSYDHSIAVARSRSAWGPWEECPHNPVLSQRIAGQSPIQATGHGDLVQDAAGEWWIVFLGNRPVGYPRFHTLGRETFATPVTWVDGWPVVDEPRLIQDDGRGRTQLPRPTAWCDEFDGSALRHEWSSIRQSNPHVRVEGGRLQVEHPDLPGATLHSFIGVRQLEHSCRVEAEIDVESAADGAEFGLTVAMDVDHYYRIVIAHDGTNRTVVLERAVRGLVAREVLGAAPPGAALLRVDATPFAYVLTCRDAASGGQVGSGAGHAMSLSSEVAGGFTGVFFGLEARGVQRSNARWFAIDYPDDDGTEHTARA
jgi:alpha-N-arabinofuranosidase